MSALWVIVPLFVSGLAVLLMSIRGRKSEEMTQEDLDAEECAALKQRSSDDKDEA